MGLRKKILLSTILGKEKGGRAGSPGACRSEKASHGSGGGFVWRRFSLLPGMLQLLPPAPATQPQADELSVTFCASAQSFIWTKLLALKKCVNTTSLTQNDFSNFSSGTT